MTEEPISVAHLTRLPAPGAFSLERVFNDVRKAFPDWVHVKEHRNAFLSQGILPRLRDAWRARKSGAKVNHITGDVHYLTFFLRKKRTVLTIHDTLIFERSSGLKRFAIWFLWYYLPVHRSGVVTVISPETKSRLLSVVRVSDKKVKVIPNPVSSEFDMAPASVHPGSFRLLHIGTKQNKNLERLIEALTGLDVELTVVGVLNDTQRQAFKTHNVKVRNVHGISDAELVEEYIRTDAVAFVSLDEGFGLPIIEAQSVGRPVISSAREPMMWVAGSAALLVDPESVNEIREGVQAIRSSITLRSKLIDLGFQNALRFSVETVSQQYADLYREVSERAGN